MVSFAATPLVGAMLPPPTPIVKRPALSLKRSNSYLDTDDEAGLTPSAKRLKVAFSDDVDVRVMEDWNEKSFELVKEEVRLGISRHLAPVEQRDDTQYARLLHILNQDAFAGDAPTTRLLKRYIMAINWRITALGECSKLVLAVLDLPWLGRDDDFVDVYTKFLVILASTHSKFISPMMDRLVSNLESLPHMSGDLPGEEHVTSAIMYDRLHLILQTLSRRVPSTASVLMRQLRHQFPNDTSSAKGHLRYQRNILRIAHELPELKTEMMALIVQRLVNIDVQIQHDIDELEDDEEDRFLQWPQLNPRDDDDEDDDVDSVSESELTTTEDETRMKDLRLKVAKMDGTQDLLFEHYAPSFTAAPDQPRQNAAYLELLSQFENFIMPNRSRHTQFLLFHFAQTSPKYATHFASHCLSTACDRNVATTVRLTACAYVASFVARGSLVEQKLVREVVHTLSSYLEDMRQLYEPNCRAPDRRAYSVYYAVAQALFYIFCFRWRDLVVGSSDPQSQQDNMNEEDTLAEGHDLLWISGLKEILNRNMHSVLNPLKVCSAEIIGEFAKIANHLRFLYVFSLLERNKRVRLGQVHAYSRLGAGIDIGRRETAWDRKTGDAHHQLEPYFPFDPYHLPLSKRWVQNEYNNWKLPRGMKQDDEDEHDESEDEIESDDESIPEDLTGEPTGMIASDAIPIGSC